MNQQQKQSKEFAMAAARSAMENNSKQVVVVDVCGMSPATNFFVIATSTSPRQARTVADDISHLSKDYDFERIGRAGYDQGRWILLDYVDVVVHIFDEEYRQYYDLEMLWGDAKKIEVK